MLIAKDRYLSTAVLAACLALSACDDDKKEQSSERNTALAAGLNYAELINAPAEGSSVSALGALSLPALSRLAEAQLGSVEFTTGEGEQLITASATFNVGFGSGAYHRAGEPNTQFYTISDRGPNIKCEDVGAVLAELNQDPGLELAYKDFCPKGDKVFPQPGFSPTIYHWQIELDENGLSTKVLAAIKLKDQSGNLITGLSNDLTATNTEKSFDAAGKNLAFDNEGLDTEALIRLQDGTFWLSDEYGPSLIHVASDGTILQRVVPESVAADLADADYPVAGLLPDIYKSRKLNRGIESLALSPDEKSLYFMMQSPLANPDTATYKTSRIVRLMKFSLNAGELGEAQGEYLYQLDRPQSFATASGEGDLNKSQSTVKISEMLALGNDDLIILERISATTKLYRIALNTGDNILNLPIHNGLVKSNESDSNKTLEQIYALAAVNARPVIKNLAFNSLTDLPNGLQLPNKIEGIALLDEEHIALINDNDFGINGDDTLVTLLTLKQPLSAESTRVKRLSMELIARHSSGVFDESAAEILDYHPQSQQIFVLNANSGQVDILDGSVLSSAESSSTAVNGSALNNLPLNSSLDIAADIPELSLGAANSLAVYGDLLAVAVEAENKQGDGIVAFYQLTPKLSFIKAVTVGALPDMLTFTPDGAKVVVANEGEPSADYSLDPEGSIAIIDIKQNMPADSATLLRFTDFNSGASRAAQLPEGVRIFGGAFGQTKSTVAQDLEPEYLAVSADSSTAYVSLQENNALAIVDLNSNSISAIKALGLKDYAKAGNQVDLSDRDSDEEGLYGLSGTRLRNGKARINLMAHKSVVGMYQPDSIAVYQYNQNNFVLTANEGDAREYIDSTKQSEQSCNEAGFLWNDGDCFSYLEEYRLEELQNLADADFTGVLPTELAMKENKFSQGFDLDEAMLGRLKITMTEGFSTESQQFETLYSYGARSFSIWNAQGEQVFDSGNDMEMLTAGMLAQDFNASNDKAANSKKNDRSSSKGPEPEALAIGQVGLRTYAFVGLERVGGIMIFDITSPYGVQFIDYVNNRDFSKDPSKEAAGDAGPEGMKFVPADNSPNGKALLMVANEVSGSTSVYQLSL